MEKPKNKPTTKSAKKRLKVYSDYLLENGWSYADGQQTETHNVLIKQRLVNGTINHIGLRAIENFVFVAIAVNGVHSYQGNIRDFNHFKEVVSDWGNR